MRPLGGLHFQPLPPALFFPPSAKAHHFFSFPGFFPRAQQTTKWRTGDGEWGMEDLGGRLRLVSAQRPPPLSAAPTWAYPCCLFLLPILAASAPPQHLDQQTCRGPGSGSGPLVLSALHPPANALPFPALPGQCLQPSLPPPGSSFPYRSSGMIFHR